MSDPIKKTTGKLTNPHSPIIRRVLANLYTSSISAFLGSILLIVYLGADAEKPVFTNAFCQNLASLVLCGASLIAFYLAGWYYGFRDINVVKCGYAEKDAYRGLKAGLYALIPSMGLWLIAVILNFFVHSFNVISVYAAFHFIFAWFYNLSGNIPYFYIIPLAILPMMIHFGFTMGYKNISIWRRLVYRKEPKQTDRRLK